MIFEFIEFYFSQLSSSSYSKFYDKYEEGIGGSTMPVAWKKNYGKGRVFYQSIGHHLKEFEIFEIMEIQKRGMRWAAESKYHSFENCI